MTDTPTTAQASEPPAAPAEPVPTDVYELAEAIHAEPAESDLYDRLEAQVGVELAIDLWAAACAVNDRNAQIDHARGRLRSSLSTAVQYVTRGQQVLDELASQRLYDVEYAEGTQGRDMAAFLNDAARALRAAAALNPVKE